MTCQICGGPSQKEWPYCGGGWETFDGDRWLCTTCSTWSKDTIKMMMITITRRKPLAHRGDQVSV